ncbi:axin isoform X7 [Spodoptera frugiperda]|uniref:Axin isoform X7 n=1 Tax=Spodoptera frugiperda TaxID=7108 RepID=A0A9R0E8E5_SPOFR|nr:axin isoform X7 [Spodoptera frugiperda]
MSHTPIGGHPQGWEHKLADRSSLPPASGEEKNKSQSKYVFAQPHLSKVSMAWREQTEGSSGSSARSPASPPYMRWARSLHELLEDAEGVRLFRKYVSGAGGLHVDRLNFYFAVQGLRQEHEPAKIRQVVSAIYKFLRKSQLAMPEELKQHVKQSLKDGSNIEKTIFDNMEQEVTRAITETTYQSFLRSDAYVSYVSAATQPLSSPDASPPHPPRENPFPQQAAVGGLATLHEGQELGAGGAGGAAPAARLTHDALLATQSRRLHSDVAPDGMSVRNVREPRESRHRPRLHGLDRHAVINKEQDTAMVIPRTARVQSEQLRVLPPAEFAPLLIEKLERVRRDQEAKERLERRLAEGDVEEASSQVLPPQLVAAAIREKLQLDDDNDQDILDQHVSRVWSERTPGASPPGGRRARPRPHPPHAARRAPSALSADSGHYDAPPDSLHHPHSLTRSYSGRSFSKKTVTELTDSGVSVVSEGGVEPRILLWMAEGERLDRLDRGERDRGDRDRADRSERRHHSRASSADRDDLRRKDKPPRAARGSGSKSSSTSGGGAESHTVVVVTFLDENVPYRFKVPASPLTLKTFKDYLPRKGNYRYFFKTNCADLDTVIQEEVSSDSDTLPMFEGKVMARVKSID